MSWGFSFHGHTMFRPGLLVNSSFGTQRVLQLLPFGTIAMLGISDGGKSDTLYQFNDVDVAPRVLRGGPLLRALEFAADLGGASGFIGIPVGAKTAASLALNGTGGATASIASGDQGFHTNFQSITIAAGTANQAVTFEWVDENGNTVTYGGKNTAFDKLTNFSDLQKAMLADPIITPNSNTGLIPKFVLTVTTDGPMSALATTNLSGGTGGDFYSQTITIAGTFGVGQGVQATVNGVNVNYTEIAADDAPATAVGLAAAINANATLAKIVLATAAAGVVTVTAKTSGSAGAYTLTSASYATAGTTATAGGANLAEPTLTTADWKTAIDVLADVAFDIGHLVGCTDAVAQAYFDGQAQTQYVYGRTRRLIHQGAVTGASPSNSKQINSEAIANSGVGAATALNSYRSSLCVQKLLTQNPRKGTNEWVDGAVLACGLAALKGATGAWGPATPLTYEYLPNVVDVDYPVLDDTGDVDNAIKNGVWLFERVGRAGTPGSVRVLQSVTTQPNDSNGNRWGFAEFSVVRVSDALLANVKATVETTSPKAVGAGNTIKTAGAVIAEVRDVVELALENQWITDYDPKSISIVPTGTTGTQSIVKYSAAPTLPLNNLGIEQTLIPFQITAATSGVVSG